MTVETPANIVSFWFGTLHDGFADATHRKSWYAFDPAFDARIAARFAQLLDQAARGALTEWRDEPESCLAYILLTDQFSRQIHRGTGRAFATDALALSAARHGVEQGLDRALQLEERAFFYMPFEHSEATLDQHTAVGLFSNLRDETPAPYRSHTGAGLRFAHQHRDIIQRFGRFPHRNAVLQRASTDQELAFLEDAGNFGQAPS